MESSEEEEERVEEVGEWVVDGVVVEVETRLVDDGKGGII